MEMHGYDLGDDEDGQQEFGAMGGGDPAGVGEDPAAMGDEPDYDEELADNGQYSQFAFPAFSPTSRKRVRLRKPNFSEECIDLLIKLVDEHKDILYTKKAYTNDVHEKKIMVWTHITSKINAITSIPRTMEEVRKKWNDYSYYVKTKRRSQDRGALYTPDPRQFMDSYDENVPRSGKRDSRRIKRREDKVLMICDVAQQQMLAGDDGASPTVDMNPPDLSHLILPTTSISPPQVTPIDITPTHNMEDMIDEAEPDEDEEYTDSKAWFNFPGHGTPPLIPKNIPRSSNIPPLPNPIFSYGYNRKKYGKGVRAIEKKTPKSTSKFKAPPMKAPSNYEAPPAKSNLPPSSQNHVTSPRGRGRPRKDQSQTTPVYNPVEEDLVMVNRKMLAAERKMLNVEKNRLCIEKRLLEIEEERFRWEQVERDKAYQNQEKST